MSLKVRGLLGDTSTKVAIAIGLTFSASIAAAAGMLDDSDKLEGQFIVDVGKLEELRCPIAGNYDCLTWPRYFYRFNYTQCMQVHGYYGGLLSATALLAVDKAKNISLFVLPGGIGNTDVKQYIIQLYDCPSMY